MRWIKVEIIVQIGAEMHLNEYELRKVRGTWYRYSLEIMTTVSSFSGPSSADEKLFHSRHV